MGVCGWAGVCVWGGVFFPVRGVLATDVHCLVFAPPNTFSDHGGRLHTRSRGRVRGDRVGQDDADPAVPLRSRVREAGRELEQQLLGATELQCRCWCRLRLRSHWSHTAAARGDHKVRYDEVK